MSSTEAATRTEITFVERTEKSNDKWHTLVPKFYPVPAGIQIPFGFCLAPDASATELQEAIKELSGGEAALACWDESFPGFETWAEARAKFPESFTTYWAHEEDIAECFPGKDAEHFLDITQKTILHRQKMDNLEASSSGQIRGKLHRWMREVESDIVASSQVNPGNSQAWPDALALPPPATKCWMEKMGLTSWVDRENLTRPGERFQTEEAKTSSKERREPIPLKRVLNATYERHRIENLLGDLLHDPERLREIAAAQEAKRKARNPAFHRDTRAIPQENAANLIGTASSTATATSTQGTRHQEDDDQGGHMNAHGGTSERRVPSQHSDQHHRQLPNVTPADASTHGPPRPQDGQG